MTSSCILEINPIILQFDSTLSPATPIMIPPPSVYCRQKRKSEWKLRWIALITAQSSENSYDINNNKKTPTQSLLSCICCLPNILTYPITFAVNLIELATTIWTKACSVLLCKAKTHWQPRRARYPVSFLKPPLKWPLWASRLSFCCENHLQFLSRAS